MVAYERDVGANGCDLRLPLVSHNLFLYLSIACVFATLSVSNNETDGCERGVVNCDEGRPPSRPAGQDLDRSSYYCCDVRALFCSPETLTMTASPRTKPALRFCCCLAAAFLLLRSESMRPLPLLIARSRVSNGVRCQQRQRS
jgi:hypothetical protein